MAKRKRPKTKRPSPIVSVLKEVMSRKMGLIAIGILIFMGTLGVIGPEISPYPGDPYKKIHGIYSAPEWMKYFDKDYFPDTNVLESHFENGLNGWRIFTAVSGNTSVEVPYSISLLHNTVNGSETPGSLEIKIIDNHTTPTGVDKFDIVLERPYMWNYTKPPHFASVDFYAALLLKNYSIEEIFGVDIGKIKVTINIYLAVARADMNVSSFFEWLISQGIEPGPDEYTPYGLRLDFGIVLNTIWGDVKHLETGMRNWKDMLFKKDVPYVFRIVFAFSFIRPQKTGEISILLDDFVIKCLSYYFGVLGTTYTGADLFSLILHGIRVSLIIGLTASFAGAAIGITFGLFSGYYGGKIDEIIQRIIDFMYIIPYFPLLLVLLAIFGASLRTILLTFIIFGWVGTAKLVRGQVLVEKAKPYVEAAKVEGAHDILILFKHILPNVLPIVFVNLTVSVSGYILSEAGLSFLGYPPAKNSLGKILFDAFSHFAITVGAWWAIFFPGLIIGLLSVGFIYLGNTLDEIFNPKLKTKK